MPATTSTVLLTFYLHLRHTYCAKHRLVRFVKGLHKTDFPNSPPPVHVCTREVKPRLVGKNACWFSPSTKIKRKHHQSWANLQPAYPCHRSGSTNASRKRLKSLGALNPALAPSYAITQGSTLQRQSKGFHTTYEHRYKIVSLLTTCKRREKKFSFLSSLLLSFSTGGSHQSLIN